MALEREVEGDLLITDMGQGCPFRAGKSTFLCILPVSYTYIFIQND